MDLPTNRGKVAAINDAVPSLGGEVIVFTDAAAMFAADAVRKLVRSYAVGRRRPVGSVCESRVDSAQIGSQEDFYWRYETFVKVLEASTGSVLGLHGQIYSMRTALYPFPSAGTINDDYVIL